MLCRVIKKRGYFASQLSIYSRSEKVCLSKVIVIRSLLVICICIETVCTSHDFCDSFNKLLDILMIEMINDFSLQTLQQWLGPRSVERHSALGIPHCHTDVSLHATQYESSSRSKYKLKDQGKSAQTTSQKLKSIAILMNKYERYFNCPRKQTFDDFGSETPITFVLFIDSTPHKHSFLIFLYMKIISELITIHSIEQLFTVHDILSMKRRATLGKLYQTLVF